MPSSCEVGPGGAPGSPLAPRAEEPLEISLWDPPQAMPVLMGGERPHLGALPPICPPHPVPLTSLSLAGWKIEEDMLGVLSQCLPALAGLQAVQ